MRLAGSATTSTSDESTESEKRKCARSGDFEEA